MDNLRTNKVHCNCRYQEEWDVLYIYNYSVLYYTFLPWGMEGRCNPENMVYQAYIFPMENSKDEKVYTGISVGNWKDSITVDIPLLGNQIDQSR